MTPSTLAPSPNHWYGCNCENCNNTEKMLVVRGFKTILQFN